MVVGASEDGVPSHALAVGDDDGLCRPAGKSRPQQSNEANSSIENGLQHSPSSNTANGAGGFRAPIEDNLDSDAVSRSRLSNTVRSSHSVMAQLASTHGELPLAGERDNDGVVGPRQGDAAAMASAGTFGNTAADGAHAGWAGELLRGSWRTETDGAGWGTREEAVAEARVWGIADARCGATRLTTTERKGTTTRVSSTAPMGRRHGRLNDDTDMRTRAAADCAMGAADGAVCFLALPDAGKRSFSCLRRRWQHIWLSPSRSQST